MRKTEKSKKGIINKTFKTILFAILLIVILTVSIVSYNANKERYREQDTVEKKFNNCIIT